MDISLGADEVWAQSAGQERMATGATQWERRRPSRALRRAPAAPEWAHGELPPWRELVQYVAHAGLQAPSWFNVQPWRLRLGPQYVDLWLDDSRDKTLFDWGRFNSLLACGALLKNMELAGLGRGLTVELDMQPDANEPDWIGRLRLGSVGPQCQEEVQRVAVGDELLALEAAVWRRSTNRSPFANQPLQAEQLAYLNRALLGQNQLGLSWLGQSAHKQQVYEASVQAELIRLGRQDLHQHLHRLIHWTRAQAAARRDGYAVPALGWDLAGRLRMSLTRKWPVMQFTRKLGWDQQMAQADSRGLLHCGALGLLTTRDHSVAGLVRAGSAMQDLWLRATVLGLQVQPHNMLPQFHWTWTHGGGAHFAPKEQLLLQQALDQLPAPWADLCPPQQGCGVVLLRIGQGPRPTAFTWRRSLKRVSLQH